MTIKYLKDGQDFDASCFSPDFGFTQSAKGRVDARNHPDMEDDGNGTYVESLKGRALAKEKGFKKGGSIKKYADGGSTGSGNTPDLDLTSGGANNFAAQLDIAQQYAQSSNPSTRAVGHQMIAALQRQQNADSDTGYRKGGKVKGYATGGPTLPGSAPAYSALPSGANTAPSTINTPGRPANMPVPQGQATGALQNATITMPLTDAAKAGANAVQMGRMAGAKQAVNSLAAVGQAAQQRGMSAPSTALAAAPHAAPVQQGIPAMAKGGHMTAAKRHALPENDFALSGQRYPINDKAHARNALARVSQHGNPKEKAEVRKAVHRKFPGIGQK